MEMVHPLMTRAKQDRVLLAAPELPGPAKD
jgi:hypothetical protein